jgi:hypothetical protein
MPPLVDMAEDIVVDVEDTALTSVAMINAQHRYDQLGGYDNHRGNQENYCGNGAGIKAAARTMMAGIKEVLGPSIKCVARFGILL